MSALLGSLLLALAAQDGDPRPGLVGEYFLSDRPLEDLPAVEPAAKPRFKRVDRQIDFLLTLEAFGGTKLRDHFHVRWTGLLRVPKAGRWTFSTVSDDGSRLFLRGKAVVENGGRHEMREKSGSADLEAGDHELRVEYFDSIRHAGVRIQWEGPGTSKEVVPAAALFHRASAAPTEAERKGIELPVEEKREVRTAAKPKEEAKREPEKPAADGPDEKVVGKDEPRPSHWGKVVSVFEDGTQLLLTLRTASGEVPVYLGADAKVGWVGVDPKDRKPAAGLTAHVWLKAGSSEAVAEARFSR